MSIFDECNCSADFIEWYFADGNRHNYSYFFARFEEWNEKYKIDNTGLEEIKKKYKENKPMGERINRLYKIVCLECDSDAGSDSDDFYKVSGAREGMMCETCIDSHNDDVEEAEPVAHPHYQQGEVPTAANYAFAKGVKSDCGCK